MNLYEMTLKQADINEMLEDAAGEITPEISQKMGELDENKKAAMCKIATIHDEFKAKEEALKSIVKIYQDKLKACQKAQDNIKAYLLDYLQETGQRKIEYEQVKVRRQASPPSVNITETAEVPDNFKKAIVTITVADLKTLEAFGITPKKIDFDVDKKAILQIWKDSKKTIETKGTQIIQKEHVRIS